MKPKPKLFFCFRRSDSRLRQHCVQRGLARDGGAQAGLQVGRGEDGIRDVQRKVGRQKVGQTNEQHIRLNQKLSI
jgi:hypothetical protein